MARALSMDLRQRIVEDCDTGMKVAEVAGKYRVTERTVFNLLALRRETGSLTPRTVRCGRKSKLAERRKEIELAVQQNPNFTLQEMIAELSLCISVSALWKTLQRWGISLKKK